MPMSMSMCVHFFYVYDPWSMIHDPWFMIHEPWTKNITMKMSTSMTMTMITMNIKIEWTWTWIRTWTWTWFRLRTSTWPGSTWTWKCTNGLLHYGLTDQFFLAIWLSDYCLQTFQNSFSRTIDFFLVWFSMMQKVQRQNLSDIAFKLNHQTIGWPI